MRQTIGRWKEGAGVFCYFLLLAYFTPRAKASGWGMEGMMFVVCGGALFIFLLYLLVKCLADIVASKRDDLSSWKEYMGIGAGEQVSLAQIGSVDEHTGAEIDAMLATNPYAAVSPELFDDDRQTRFLMPAVSAGTGDEDERPAEQIRAIICDNPRRRLNLAPNFQPDANDLLATGVFFVGIPGSGKTATLALLLEQYILRFRLAAVVFDIAGDLKSIVQDGLCPRGMIATPETMPDMAQVVAHRLQVVIDLQQCRRPGEQFINYELAGQLIARTVKQIMNAQAAIPSESRLPCLLGLDETHIWTPQTPPSYLSGGTAKDLLDTLTVVATTGRKYGVVPLLACQRIPKVHKDIIAGCETRLLGKVDLDNDIARYRDYVSKDVISDTGIRSLGKGRMVVCLNGQRLIVQFNERQSRHTSHTPGVTGALRQIDLVGNIPPDLLASITRPVPAVQAEPVRVAQEGDGQERKTSGTLPAPVPDAMRGTTPLARPAKATLSPELAAALEVYQPGMSYRDLGQALGVSKDTAGGYIKQLKAMRMI